MASEKLDRVVYVATGDRYIREVAKSMNSLWQHNPELKVGLYTDESGSHLLEELNDSSLFSDLLEILPHPNVRRSVVDKAEALRQSHFERILYLDTDTRICGRLDDLFELLSTFDIAAAHAPIRFGPMQPELLVNSVPRAVPELNTGVLAFRRSPVLVHLLERWSDTHREALESVGERVGDQGAFRVAVYESGARLAVLPPEYNCRFTFPTYLDGLVRILHGRGPDLAITERLVNKTTGPRVFVPGIGILSGSRKLARWRRKYDTWRSQGSLTIVRSRLRRYLYRSS